MVRVKDLAEQFHVSPATMSLVLNGRPNISNKTRNRILTEMIQSGYGDLITEEAMNASTLKRTDANPESAANEAAAMTPVLNQKLALVVFKDNGELVNQDSFLPLILVEMEETAKRYGYQLIIITVEKSNLDSQISYIKESGCVGFVLFATEMHEMDLSSFEALKIPFVLLDNFFPEHKVSSVVVNNNQGMSKAVHYLLTEGHKKIGYLSSGLDINSFNERRNFAVQALHNAGLDCTIYTIGYSNEIAYEGMRTLLSKTARKDLPTAFLSDNDLVAFGAIQAIQSSGYRVPEDFSVIGYDNRPICTLITPAITTVELPRNAFGTEALEMLVRKINNAGFPFISTGICCNLIKRDSVSSPDTV